MKNVVLTASSCALGRRIACLSKLSRKVIEDVSEFLPSISPYGTHPSPCFLDIRLVVTDTSMSGWYDGINQKLLRLWLMCARLSEPSKVIRHLKPILTSFAHGVPANRESNPVLTKPCRQWRAARESHPTDCTRLVKMRSCLIELLIRDLRPVGSVSQIGGQYPLCAFSADIILTYNDRTERTTFNYCTLYTCLQSFWHCREIPPLLVLLFVPSFCILRNAE